MQINSLQLAWKINHSYRLDKFFGIVVEGIQRIGKSSYGSQSMAEAFGEWDCKGTRSAQEWTCLEPDYEPIKKWIVYPPREFLDIVLDVGISEKQRVLHWDDAGFWLFVLDWYEPFVKTVAKYLQLAGRQFSAIILSSPSQRMISGKVLEALPQLYVCKIIQVGRDTLRKKPRLAKVYQRWNYPDGKKGGVRTKWKDKFDAMLPDEFFNWYKPKSDMYLAEGLKLLEKEVHKMQKKMDKKAKDDFMEEVEKVSGATPDRLKEVQEVIAQIQGGMKG